MGRVFITQKGFIGNKGVIKSKSSYQVCALVASHYPLTLKDVGGLRLWATVNKFTLPTRKSQYGIIQI